MLSQKGATALNSARAKAMVGLMATLSGFFGVLATILAMVGLYGVISYMVIRHRNEIGARMALGANRSNILLMVLREAAILLGGVVVGTGLAMAAGAAASSMLYGLKPRDPLTLGAAIAGMTVVALVASLLPAQRAATVPPMAALREEKATHARTAAVRAGSWEKPTAKTV